MSAALDSDAVAIVGMAGRFPGARDLTEFWRNLAGGVDSITREQEPVPPSARPHGARTWIVNAGGVLEDVEWFDADFFAVPPAEAAWMDPQHRLFLECAWHALEDAGRRPSDLECPVSIYAGTNFNSYLPARLDQLAGKDTIQFMQIFMANEKDFLTTRVSYKLNLRGESIVVQTSCSTSLVAVHLACQSLISSQSDMALAGGVSIRIPQQARYAYEAGMIASPDGYCRPFDHRAAGTVPGNGVGVVALKRLADAVADRDHCYAVIKGSWVNNDGHGKVGFTAPAVEAQAAVIARSLAMANVRADSIGYIETHGTGTPIGDPIEIEALTRAFRQHTSRRGFCALGALKASIGHLDTAAGIAGLIKASLALHHRCIPPAAYFERPHPSLNLQDSPFYINTSPVPWQAGPTPRRAGVSGFGVGGTNVHLVLQEAPERTRTARARPLQIVTVSAKTRASCQAAVASLVQHVGRHPAIELRDVAYTRNVGRSPFPHRQFAVASTPDALIETLTSSADLALHAQSPPSIVFMFAGQGAQTVGMGRRLYQTEPIFRDALDACVRHADARLGVSLRDVMFGESGEHASEVLARPEFALPALFSLEYALTEVWRAWGIVPDAFIGHSYGELVAACIGGAFSREDAIALAIERGRLMGRMPPGVMLAVPLPEQDIIPMLGDQVSLASVNGDARTVLSGSTAAIAGVEDALRLRSVPCRRLDVPFGYHSSLLDPLLDDYASLVGAVPRAPLRVRGVSSRTGDWLTDAEVRDSTYWARQMREPVRFADGLRRLRAAGHTCFVEIGPGRTLTPFARLALDRDALVVSSLDGRGGMDADWHTLLTAAGRLWLVGAPIDWRALERNQAGWSIPLPGYAFDRQRHWIETTAYARAAAAAVGVGKSIDTDTESVAASAPTPAPNGHGHDGAGHEHESVDADPRAAAERTLCAIWCEVFGRSSVGIHDDFLQLGGDSLAAIRIQSRLQQALGVELPIEQLLLMTTIAELAPAVAEQIAARAALALAPDPAAVSDVRDTVPARGPARGPLSFAQEWLWTLHTLEPDSPAYHLPVAVRLRGAFVPRDFAAAVQEVAGRHDTLRTVFTRADEPPAGIVRSNDVVPLLMVDLSSRHHTVSHVSNGHAAARGVPHAAQDAARRVIRSLTMRPFDIAAAPPWRASVVRVADDEYIAVFVVHHIISDAWSMRLLASEVAACYTARRERRPSALRELRLQYPAFAARQRAAVDHDGGELVAYWKRQLAGVPPLLTLSHRPRPAMRSLRGGRVAFTIGAALVGSLNDLARQERATLFMVLLTAYQVLLSRLGDQDDFCVGVPTAGRLDPDVEPLIGCFMNTLPIRANLRGHPTFLELLQRVRRTVLDAFARQALPFERIVQELRPTRTLSHTPLFQVIFDFNSVPRGARRAASGAGADGDPGVHLEWVGTPMATAKTDLIVDLMPTDDGALDGSVEFDRALFDDERVAAMMASFITLLDAIAMNPVQRVIALPLESDDARAQRASGAREREEESRERLLAVRASRRGSHVTHGPR